MRSGLIVNDEMPMSYFLPLTPVMMLPNFDGFPLGLDAEFCGDLVEEIDVEALDRLAVGGQELIRCVGRVGADLDHPRTLDALGQLARKVHVLADRDRRGFLCAGLPAQRARSTGAQSKCGD